VGEKLASGNPTGLLTLQASTFGRTTRATAEGARRIINTYCSVTEWNLIDVSDKKLGKRSFRKGKMLQLWIAEGKPNESLWEEPEKIGVFDTEHMHANIFLHPDAFTHFWAAAGSTSGATRSIELALKAKDVAPSANILSVTNIGLFESIPTSMDHPVVAELRGMQQKLGGLSNPLMGILYGALAAGVVVIIFRWLYP
jgi:quinolinate synthase